MTLPKLILAIDNLDVGTKVLVIYLTLVFTWMAVILPLSIVAKVATGVVGLAVLGWAGYHGWQWLVAWARRHV